MIMNPMKLSVIIPIYNARCYLVQTLDSLCSQVTDGIEIILIDDGSTDESAEICDRYARIYSFIRVEHTPNGGVSKARNHGLQLAKGEIVTFVDSDDWVEPDYCSTIIREMQGVDMMVYNAFVHRCDMVETTSFVHIGIFETELDIADALGEIHYPNNRLGWPWNKAFRRKIIEEVQARFPEDISLFEDEVFVLQYCTKVHALRIIPQVLYNYCVNENSLSCRSTAPETFIKIANYIDALSEHFKQERFLSGIYWQVMWLKVNAYKRQKNHTCHQFRSINMYYKSREPIIKLCPSTAMNVVFGHYDWISYCLYVCIRFIGKI